ncbi:MAG: YncE family protein [Sandaracinaceae bacterium]
MLLGLLSTALFSLGCEGPSSEGDAGPEADSGRIVDAGDEDAGPDVDSGGVVPVDIPEGEVYETRGRLSIADRDTPTARVWDLDVRGEVTTYEVGSGSVLYSASSRQITAVVATQPSVGFDVFGVGVWVWDHVEHFHVYKDPSVIQVDDMLAHRGNVTDVHVNGGWVVAFDDTTGTTTALFERSIGPLRTDVARSRAVIFRTVEGAPHDGLAVVARGHLFTTRADGGIDRYEPTSDGFGDPVFLNCAAPGAAEASGFRAVFDCADGFLVVRWDATAEAFEELRVPRAEGMERPSRMIGEDDLTTFVGLVGDRTIVFVDTDAGAATSVELDDAVLDMEIDRDAGHLLVLTETGSLVDLDPVTGAELGTLALGASSTLYDVAVGDGFAYVSEPDAGLVHEVDLSDLTATGPLEVGGTPAHLVVTALWPGGEPVMH